MMFQSSPAPRSGCNYAVSRLYALLSVSILTRSEERVQRRAEQRFKRAFDVSILTRSEERVQHPAPPVNKLPKAVPILPRPEERVQLKNVTVKVAQKMFQSSPAPRSGCNPGRFQPQRSRALRFNPHPLRGAGATGGMGATRTAEIVSILTRSEERVQRDRRDALAEDGGVSILTRSEERVQQPSYQPETEK